MRKLIILCTALMMISSIPTVMAIAVDGYKEPGEWNDDWAFAQYNASTFDQNGPFGDRLVIRQGGYESPLPVTNLWYDTDPKNDSGPGFAESMATLGGDSGFDISRIYARYDPNTDTVFGLTEVYGIPGDVDGNGDVNTQQPADTGGPVGPAGSGLGLTEFWHLRLIQDGTASGIELIGNDWIITENGLGYGDIDARFTSNQANSVYEIALRNVSQHYSVAPGAVLAMQLIAGSSADAPGEDTATVFIKIPDPDIRIVKYVQGNDGVWYDANTPATGPVMDNGSAVDWRYVVTNTGDEKLENVVVTDDQDVVVTCLQDTLDVGETMTCTATGTVLDPCVPYANMGEVEGDGVVSGITVTDEDPAHYRCPDVPALTPAGLIALIGILGMIGIVGMRRRD